MIDVEICIDCTDQVAALAAASAALEGGAKRIECCRDMQHGGLTPDLSILQEIIDGVGGKMEIVVMIRPREGDFQFSRPERLTMLTQAQDIIAMGVDGIVFGSVIDGQVDEVLCEEMALYASYNGVKSTFHRAFDALSDPLAALEFLSEAHFQRILTSGTPWGSNQSAEAGIENLNAYAIEAPSMEVVIGGGVRAQNVSSLISGFSGRRFSLHAYSSVLENGKTSAVKVKELVEMAQKTR